MTRQTDSDRFRAALDHLDLTQLAFAKIIGRTDRTVRRWASGDTAIPHSVWMAIEQLQRREARR